MVYHVIYHIVTIWCSVAFHWRYRFHFVETTGARMIWYDLIFFGMEAFDDADIFGQGAQRMNHWWPCDGQTNLHHVQDQVLRVLDLGNEPDRETKWMSENDFEDSDSSQYSSDNKDIEPIRFHDSMIFQHIPLQSGWNFHFCSRSCGHWLATEFSASASVSGPLP